MGMEVATRPRRRTLAMHTRARAFPVLVVRNRLTRPLCLPRRRAPAHQRMGQGPYRRRHRCNRVSGPLSLRSARRNDRRPLGIQASLRQTTAAGMLESPEVFYRFAVRIVATGAQKLDCSDDGGDRVLAPSFDALEHAVSVSKAAA